MKKLLQILILISCFGQVSLAQNQENRWYQSSQNKISWDINKDETHHDHIEMSGLFVSGILRYGVEKGVFKEEVELVFPMLRTIPNNTRASLMHTVKGEKVNFLKVEGESITPIASKMTHSGILDVLSSSNNLEILNQFYPSIDHPVFFNRTTLINKTSNPINIDLSDKPYLYHTPKSKGVDGAYTIQASPSKKGKYTIEAGDKFTFATIYTAYKKGERETEYDADYELNKRNKFINETMNSMVLETPDEVINTTFSFAKIRFLESINETKGGLMHVPGGGNYYAAIWANDQAEYANPIFAYFGNLAGNASAINSFRHFARFMNDEYKPIPSSIIAEGTDIWNGAGDRGDMAMIAYGASRFALSYGNEQVAKELWPLIKWCLEYSNRKINSKGVVLSDSDELEGRFPAGDANLNTSSLYYDALISSIHLGRELKLPEEEIKKYEIQARNLKQAIDDYFHTEINGYDTYQYFEGNDSLRAWICTPLTVDIFDRKEGTIDALFSEKLWTKDGLASEAGNTTFWDRATLYALRGVFAAGETEKALHFMHYYSQRRLLGEHVPYPVEAYPEGNQRHLSAESALYCRIITEGILGIRPIGLDKFTLTPNLPEDWSYFKLNQIKAFNKTFSINIERVDSYLEVTISNDNAIFNKSIIKNGDSIDILLSNQESIK